MAKRLILIIAALVLVVGLHANASATTQNPDLHYFSGFGSVDYAAPENPLGISAGDPVSWDTAFNPAWLDGPGVLIGQHTADGAYLTHNIGSFSFYEYQDVGFEGGFPGVTVSGGAPSGFNFIVDFSFEETMYRYESFGNTFSISQFIEPQNPVSFGFPEGPPPPDGAFVYGTFNDLEAVPVPAAVWLLGSGLIGLAGLRRKYRR